MKRTRYESRYSHKLREDWDPTNSTNVARTTSYTELQALGKVMTSIGFKELSTERTRSFWSAVQRARRKADLSMLYTDEKGISGDHLLGPISMAQKKERYTRRYEANACGGARAKAKEDAAATSGALPVGFDPLKQEGALDYDHNALIKLLNSVTLQDPQIKQSLYTDLSNLLIVAATAKTKPEYDRYLMACRKDFAKVMHG